MENNPLSNSKHQHWQNLSHECEIIDRRIEVTLADSSSDTIQTPSLIVYVDRCISETDITPLNNSATSIVTHNTFGWSDSVKDAVFFPEIAYHYPSYSVIATADAGKDMRTLAKQYAGKTTCLCFTNNGTENKQQLLTNLLRTDGFKKIEMWPRWYSSIKVSTTQVTYFDLRQNKQKQKFLNVK